MAKVNVYGELNCAEVDGKLARTDQIYDYAKGKYQSEINDSVSAATQSEIQEAIQQLETTLDDLQEAEASAVSDAQAAIGESKEDALEEIAQAIENLEVHYDIETDKGAVKDVQLKDGQGNKLMPRTTTENVTTQKGDTSVSVIDTVFDLNSKSIIQMDLTFMEQGTMSIRADGTYSKGAATSGFVRLKKSAMHLNAKTIIKIKSGVQLYIGGMYDDGTPVTSRSWILRAGGTYYIDKPGTFAVILRYVGTPPFDGETYTAEDLASHMTIVGNEIITETLGAINDMEKQSALTPSEGITLNMDFLEIAGLQMANDGTANKYPMTVTRLCPISTYFYLHKGTIIRADSGAQMMIGGYMDDGTFFKPTTFQISGADGGAYHCAKNGHYYFVARFVGEPAINSEGYPQENLASKIHIIPPAIRKSKTDYSIRCIAHQGLSNNVSFSPYGNSRVSSYINAAVAGFTHGECDLQFTSDGVAVCCHDASFTDSSSGTTYVIAENTLETLKAATYYGEKIATFDEVVAACKSVGLGLYIDRVGEINTDARWSHILGVIKKYNYGKKVRWLDFNAKIIEFDAESKFSLIPASNAVANVVSMLNNYSSQYPAAEFTANVNSTYVTAADVQAINSQVSGRTGVEVWTINNYKSYKDYLPYVSGITSDNYNEAMI